MNKKIERLNWEIQREKQREARVKEIAAAKERRDELINRRNDTRKELFRKRLEISLKKQALSKWLSMGGKAWEFDLEWSKMYKEARQEVASTPNKKPAHRSRVTF
jgi:hypothetical protein